MPQRPNKIAKKTIRPIKLEGWSGDGFYNSMEWRRLAKYHKSIEPLCRECLKEGKTKQANVSDHILQRELRPDLELDINNLQALCYHHHAVKTGKERIIKRNE